MGRSNHGVTSARRRTLKVLLATIATVATVVVAPVMAAPASAATQGVLGVSGTTFTVNGVPAEITGYDAYSLGTQSGVNAGCGGNFNANQLAAFFKAVPAGSLVRFDAFQGAIGTQVSTDQITWAPLDRIFTAAAAAHVWLIPVLANEYGGCDDGQYKDLSWFQGGYTQLAPASLATASNLPAPVMSYQAWVQAVVARYATSPALGMWEPINEAAGATCIGAPVASAGACNGGKGSTCAKATAEAALSSFFTAIGGEIHSLDPGSLVEAGLQGSGQCGSAGADYQAVGSSPGIDVLDLHDGYGNVALGGDQNNGVRARLNQAKALNKPLLIMDNGIAAGSGCLNQDSRSIEVEDKAQAQLQAGAASYLYNNVVPSTSSTCTVNVVLGDPLIPGLSDLVGTASATSGTIATNGTQLTLNGSNVKLTGFNAYELATDWGVNAGCGGDLGPSGVNAFFQSLPADSLVRFDAFQSSLGINVTTGQIDWTGFDQVFALAAQDHIFLVPILAGEWGGCDGQFKDLSWFQSGYTQVGSAAVAATDNIPAPVMSYQAWVQAFVSRYTSSPALGMWEPIGEAEADVCAGAPVAQVTQCGAGAGTTCVEAQAQSALSSFFTTIGGEIHSLDPSHLVEAGLLGGGQCGTQGNDYQTLGASPGIDVLSFHDYYNITGNPSLESVAGGGQFDGVLVRLKQASNLNKPIIDGEDGVEAGGSCDSDATRAQVVAATAQNQFSPPASWGAATGVAAFMQWDFVPAPVNTPSDYPNCSYDILSGDPIIAALSATAVVPAP